jgi:hypothetical protein
MGYYFRFPKGIPLLKVYSVRVTHPSATRVPRRALPFDLHVLGLPLAFILSQDQTLQTNKSSFLFGKLYLAFFITLLLFFFQYFKELIVLFIRTIFFFNLYSPLRLHKFFQLMSCSLASYFIPLFRLGVQR